MITDDWFTLLRRPYQVVRVPLRLIEPVWMEGLYRWGRESLDSIVGGGAKGRPSEVADELAVRRDNARRARLEAREIAEYEAIEVAWAATRDRMRLASEAVEETAGLAGWKAQEDAARVARKAAEAPTRRAGTTT